jgi:cobalt-zinc-cadmium efflux system membrane fusion protein
LSEAEIAASNAAQKLAALGAAASEGPHLNRLMLRAPFDGVVVEKHLSVGEAVKEDASAFTIADLSRVWAEANVSASDLGAAQVGVEAQVSTAASDGKAIGTVAYVGALLGEQTRTAKLRIALSNPQMAWRPGQYVDIDLPRKPRQAGVAVRSDTIQSVDGKPTVFTQVAGGFKAQQVKLGRDDGQHVEILEGLVAGSRYAAKGSFVIKAEQGKNGAEHDH